jgi:hypothetical protein
MPQIRGLSVTFKGRKLTLMASCNSDCLTLDYSLKTLAVYEAYFEHKDELFVWALSPSLGCGIGQGTHFPHASHADTDRYAVQCVASRLIAKKSLPIDHLESRLTDKFLTSLPELRSP